MTTNPDFAFTIYRDGKEIDLRVEVLNYREPYIPRGMDSRDPACDPGEVDFGKAVIASSGEEITLTPEESIALETKFWS